MWILLQLVVVNWDESPRPVLPFHGAILSASPLAYSYKLKTS